MEAFLSIHDPETVGVTHESHSPEILFLAKIGGILYQKLLGSSVIVVLSF